MAGRKQGYFWPALAVAFILGLLPGLGVLAYQRAAAPETSSAAASADLLRSQRAAWDAEKSTLTAELDASRKQIDGLEARIETLTVALAAAKAGKPEPKPASGKTTAPQIVERRVDGEGQAGGPLTLVVRVKGDADRVAMRLARIHPDSDWVKTYELKDAGTLGGVHTWKASITAPDERGDYRFFADAWLDDTHVSMAGTAQYVITLE